MHHIAAVLVRERITQLNREARMNRVSNAVKAAAPPRPSRTPE